MYVCAFGVHGHSLKLPSKLQAAVFCVCIIYTKQISPNDRPTHKKPYLKRRKNDESNQSNYRIKKKQRRRIETNNKKTGEHHENVQCARYKLRYGRAKIKGKQHHLTQIHINGVQGHCRCTCAKR